LADKLQGAASRSSQNETGFTETIMNVFSIGCAMLASILAAAPHAGASVTEETWSEFSPGDLMKVGVEPASRISQAVSNPAASVFVVSADDV
jgi:hypothetical protein